MKTSAWKADLKERIAVALFERWEDEGEADPARSENHVRESWDRIPEGDRDHWRGWADAALSVIESQSGDSQ